MYITRIYIYIYACLGPHLSSVECGKKSRIIPIWGIAQCVRLFIIRFSATEARERERERFTPNIANSGFNVIFQDGADARAGERDKYISGCPHFTGHSPALSSDYQIEERV